MRIYGRVLDLFGLLAGLGYAVTAVMTAIDVALRNSGAGSINGLVDLIEYGLFASTFLAAPWVLQQGGHVRVDFVVNTLPRFGRKAADMFGNLLGLLVSAIMLHYSVRVTVQAYDQGSLILKSIVFPEWWALAVIPVATLMLTVEFARRLFVAAQPGGRPEL